MTAHWAIEDPAAPEAPKHKQASQTALLLMERRISLLLSLPVGSVDRMSLHNRLRDIGRSKDAEPQYG